MRRNKSLTVTLLIIALIAFISLGFKVKPMINAYEDFLPKVVYDVSYNFYTKGIDRKVFVKTFLPESNNRQKISNVKQKANDMKFRTEEQNENLRAIWRAQSKDKFYTINYAFTYKGKAVKYLIDDNLSLRKQSDTILYRYLKPETYIEVNHNKIDVLASDLAKNKSDLKSLIKSIYDYVHNIPSAPIRDLTSALKAYEQNQASCNGKARLFVALCRNRGIPARLKGGLILEDTKKRTSHLWAEVYITDHWVPFDVLNGHFAYLPAHYLELYTGDHFLITHTPNILFDYNYTMEENQHIPFMNVTTDDALMDHPISLLKLSRSGIVPKHTLHFLLLLPLGGLIIALLKNVLGLKTYGVFLPILIAYTFTSTGYITGMFLFLIITGLVALISVPLNNWGLLYTPKIVIILTFTVIMIFIFLNVGLSYKLDWLTAISFFPIIILSIMAERFARAIEEDGTKKALNNILQTLVATSVCYLVFASTTIKMALLIFPEIILLLVIVTLLLGKWIGLRVSEYRRFSFIIR
ncbi:7TM domain-containing protein [Psychroserpens luteolus]|uniref:7TM domain-containing protein n=1 Tax=Psychroserpens luteolus TaxID=2855840 RepID=UPI001E450756|nr:7TM domain-containing protein [Psychroserpens luteolus]MCD2258349.1 hypothetical protein [Psychroserpens luteolus]